LDEDPVALARIGPDLAPAETTGEWIGLVRLSAEGAALVRAELEAMRKNGTLAAAGMPELLNRLIARGHAPRVLYVAGHWLDVDDAFDLASARNAL
jgi:phosphoenolpyruvate phosphomutase